MRSWQRAEDDSNLPVASDRFSAVRPIPYLNASIIRTVDVESIKTALKRILE